MRVVLSIVIPGLVLAACAAPADQPRLGRAAQPVINGEDSPSGSEDAVVLLMHAANAGVAGCTATLIAPNLLLTALHCVAETDESSACNEKGRAIAGGDVGKVHDAKDMYVFTGTERPNFYSNERPPIAATGQKIFVPDSDTICANDIALILLDKNVEGAVIAPLRLDAPVTEGETFTSVGWGVTERTASPRTRKRRLEVPVVGVGPLEASSSRGALGPSEFEVGESICSGDSGGPAISTDTGAVLGVVSRGGNGRQGTQSDPAAGCEGARAFNIYTGVAGHRDLILSAFAEAEATPWLEGELNPILGVFGSECSDGAECQQGVCAQTDGSTSTCNLDCTDAACPSGHECSAVDGQNVCTAIPEPEEKTGCAVAEAGLASDAGLVPFGLALAALCVVRRRTSRR